MSSFSIKGRFSPNIFSSAARAFSAAAAASAKLGEIRLILAASLAFSVTTAGKCADVPRLKKSFSFIDSISQEIPPPESLSAKTDAAGGFFADSSAARFDAAARARAGYLKNFSAAADAATETGGIPAPEFPRKFDDRQSGARFGRRIPPSKSTGIPVPRSRMDCKIS